MRRRGHATAPLGLAWDDFFAVIYRRYSQIPTSEMVSATFPSRGGRYQPIQEIGPPGEWLTVNCVSQFLIGSLTRMVPLTD